MDRLLIADDEADIVTMLTSFFEGKGYEVMTASDGIETLKQVEKRPDLILLDISMPGLNGLEVCRRIRDHIDCPILFLTAKIEDMDKVKGFSVGGDDYIVKPFSLAELEARVSAHLRRQARHSIETFVKFTGDLTIDFAQRSLFYGKEEIPMTKRNLTLWSCCPKIQGRCLTRNEFTRRSGAMTARGTAVLLRSISAGSGQKLPHTQITLILKQFGGVVINGAVKTPVARSLPSEDPGGLYHCRRPSGPGPLWDDQQPVQYGDQEDPRRLPGQHGKILPHQRAGGTAGTRGLHRC